MDLNKNFNKQANNYDKQWQKLAPMKEALHMSIRFVLSRLPGDARILCIGVGTGDELLYLADAFPGWQFTLVEPAANMLEICKKRAKEHGIHDRCTFHEGYIDALPPSKKYHAATALLVSQFMTELDDRISFFKDVSNFLTSGGIFISADLCANMASDEFKSMSEVWFDMLKYSGSSVENIENMLSSWSKMVAITPRKEIEQMLITGGFDTPVLFCQTLFIHAWFSKVK